MIQRIKQLFCRHQREANLRQPTWKTDFNIFGWPMLEYKTKCEKCGKDVKFRF